MPIRVLPPEITAKIAAGEVVERPASVVKELVENAIDAGAREIRVEIVRGGRRLIQVADDGCGIAADEVELAFARHATSKLVSVEDLYRVRTLGFRGEASASIAAVAYVTLSTRAAGEEVGTVLRLEGGEIVHRESRARALGTTVRVENLFYNTPARLGFLRSEATETGHVGRLVASYAFAFPGIRFQLESNGRLMLRTLGTGKLADVALAVYGLDVVEQLLPLESEEGDEAIRVWGLVSAPGLYRSNRRDLVFFVNRRWIQNRSLAYAVEEAYRTLLPQGRHPLAIIHIEMPPEEVDVNVHPTKQEVRFRRQNRVFGSVQRAVRRTLLAQSPVTLARNPFEGRTGDRRPIPAGASQLAMEIHRPLGVEGGAARLTTVPEPESRLPMLRVIGQVAQTYIVAEGPGGLYLIDQHAAHERIRYEALEAQRASSGIVTQQLLEPLTLEFPPEQAALLEAHLADLAAFGFDVSPFGGRMFLVRSVPDGLSEGAIGAALSEMLDAVEGGEGFSWTQQALVTLACHTAVRAGQTLSLQEMRDLVRQLERCALPHSCPHGRPTIIHLSNERLEREFGRR